MAALHSSSILSGVQTQDINNTNAPSSSHCLKWTMVARFRGRVTGWALYRESTDSSVLTEDGLDCPATSKVRFKNKRNNARHNRNGRLNG
eukprot:scaffold42819_cov78-Cyclotella_meneghiniana.AAC.3